MKFAFLCLPLFLFFLCILLPIDENLIVLSQAKLPPSALHWLGTDLLGRDLFWRILASFRVSCLVGFGSSSLALIFALIFVAFFHFYLHTLGEKIIEMFLVFPSLVFVMFIQSFFKGGIWTMILVIGLGHWALIAKVLNSEINKVSKQDFYQCSRLLGFSKFKALLSDILPACIHIIVMLWILNFVHAIANEATLSFFGLGIEPSKASFGNILADSSKAIFVGGWWMIVFPVLALMMLILPMLFGAHFLQKKKI